MEGSLGDEDATFLGVVLGGGNTGDESDELADSVEATLLLAFLLEEDLLTPGKVPGREEAGDDAIPP